MCTNPKWYRPTDVDNLWGDPTKAKTVLGWNPQETSYEKLIEIMAEHDRKLAKEEKAMRRMKYIRSEHHTLFWHVVVSEVFTKTPPTSRILQAMDLESP